MDTNKYVAYTLGLLWADGSIGFANNRTKTPIIKHSCVSTDYDDISKAINIAYPFRNFITKNIGSYSTKKNSMVCSWMSNRKLGQFLIDNDYRNKSTSPDKILSLIDPKFKRYWFRGYFDGDGCLSIKYKGHKSLTFTSCSTQDWRFVKDLFVELKIEKFKERIVKSRGFESSQIRITRKEDILKFCNYIFEDYDNVGLKRKYEKYLILLQH